MLMAALVLIAGGAWWWRAQPNRVKREHANTTAAQFAFLAKRVDVATRNARQMSRSEAEQDLDELEWLLENRFSYLKRTGVDYRAALDSIRAGLGEQIGHGTLAVQLGKLMALFGDGHSTVRPSVNHLCERFLPFLVGDARGGLVAFWGDRGGFLDAEHPYLHALDGVPVATWLDAGRLTLARGSKQFVRCASLRRLGCIGHLRRELGLTPSDVVDVELGSADGSRRRTIRLPLAARPPVHGPRPNRPSQILPGHIGYLAIPFQMNGSDAFLDGLKAAMQLFRDTDGLIIDIRGNGGGSRAPLRVLFPFFMAQDDPPRVINIAAYRLGHRKDILTARWLFPAGSGRFSAAEATAIRQAAERFESEWHLPEGEFSEWHYFVIGPSQAEEYYHYDRPVIVLMESFNFSACDIFLGAFKGWRNVTMMGTPSGGGSGRRQPYQLRNGQYGVRLSSMASFRPDGRLYDGKGIGPDVLLEPIATDFIGRTDTILEAALERLRAASKTRP